MGTLDVTVRDAMLDAIRGEGTGTINYIELIETEYDYDFGRHAITWGPPENGVVGQTGTITIEEEMESSPVKITGFRFYETTDEEESSKGSGEFTEPLELEGVYGKEYTFKVSGIQIELPE